MNPLILYGAVAIALLLLGGYGPFKFGIEGDPSFPPISANNVHFESLFSTDYGGRFIGTRGGSALVSESKNIPFTQGYLEVIFGDQDSKRTPIAQLVDGNGKIYTTLRGPGYYPAYDPQWKTESFTIDTSQTYHIECYTVETDDGCLFDEARVVDTSMTATTTTTTSTQTTTGATTTTTVQSPVSTGLGQNEIAMLIGVMAALLIGVWYFVIKR